MKRLCLIFSCTYFIMGAISSAYSQTQSADTNHYQLLFEKSLYQGCAAAFYRGSLLYVVSKAKTRLGGVLGYVYVYDPRTGIFAETSLINPGKGHCRNVNLSSTNIGSSAELNYVKSIKFRTMLDHFRENPDGLKAVLSAGLNGLHYQFSVYGKPDTLELDGQSINHLHAVSDIAKYLIHMTMQQAQSMTGERESEYAEKQAHDKAQALQSKQAHALWDNRMSMKLAIGDQVCTYDTNQFGYVERMVDSKVRVQVVGRVDSINAAPGYFFNGKNMQFHYKKIESIRWFNRNELAPCKFEA